VAEPRRSFVLFVDDDADTRELAEIVLRNAGFQCQAVRTAREALAAAAVIRFDVAVVDVHLRDGLELARRLLTAKVPPLLVAQTEGTQGEVPADIGFIAHLQKPYLPEKLVDTIVRVTSRA
jgi:DNA-binding response OmpR family regulator